MTFDLPTWCKQRQLKADEVGKAAGAEVMHEPRVWPEYHPTYYGAFVRDPDGNNVEAVCHTPE